MKFKNPYWGIKTKFELLEKWILVHSAVYYELNKNIVSDFMYDMNSKQLAELIRENRKEHKSSRWYYVFKDFDGSTGFDLCSRLNEKDSEEIKSIALNLVKTRR